MNDTHLTHPARAAANDDGPSPATRQSLSAPTRELAQRLSGTAEVLLTWHPESDRLELSVQDLSTGAGFRIEVAPANAIDAFYHPYAYAARRENSHRVVRTKTKLVDG
jgi:hypothetical protein